MELNALCSALLSGTEKNLQELISAVPISDMSDYNSEGRLTPLFCACRGGSADAVASILSITGIDLNKGEEATRRTPLHGIC